MAVKLSKQELEGPDVFQSSIERITDYIAENKTRFYAIVTVLVVVIAAALGGYFYWNNYSTSAVRLYAQAQDNLAQNPGKPEAVKESITLYKRLIEKYPHSWSAKTANYNLGNIYYNQGDVDLAIASYKSYISATSDDNSGIRFMALTSLGYCYEDKKDFKAALNYFAEAQKSRSSGFESIAYRNIARIYEQMNDRKKAIENYQNALQKTTDPSMIIFIKHKIASLG